MGMSEPTLRVEVLLSSHHQSPEESVVASCAAAAERPVRARGLGAEGMHGLKPCPALAVAILDPPTIIAFTRCTVSFYHSGRSEWAGRDTWSVICVTAFTCVGVKRQQRTLSCEEDFV